MFVTGCLNLMAQEYQDPPLPYGQDYREPLNSWGNMKTGDLKTLPNGYYKITVGDQEPYDLDMSFVKKGDAFLANGVMVTKESAFYMCAKGNFKDTRLLFDEIIRVKPDDIFDSGLAYRIGSRVDLPEIDIKDYQNSIRGIAEIRVKSIGSVNHVKRSFRDALEYSLL